MKSNNTQKIRQDNSCAVISFIFACKLREAIISLLNERAAPLRCSLNRAEKELRACWSRAIANDHRDTLRNSLKFVQEVDRFVTSRFFGEKKVARGGVLKVAKLATLRASLLLTSLSVWLQQHTHFQKYTHVQEYLDHGLEYLDHGQSEGGSTFHYLWLV